MESILDSGIDYGGIVITLQSKFSVMVKGRQIAGNDDLEPVILPQP